MVSVKEFLTWHTFVLQMVLLTKLTNGITSLPLSFSFLSHPLLDKETPGNMVCKNQKLEITSFCKAQLPT